MTNKNHSDIDVIIDYLYGEMSPADQKFFEERLKSDADFQKLFEQNQSFDGLVKAGSSAEISDARMSAVNYSLSRKLRKQQHSEGSLLDGLSMIWQSKVSFKAQFASMAFTFLLGAFLFQSTSSINELNQNGANSSAQPQAISLIQNDDYQITGLSLSPVGIDGKRVRVSYSLTSNTQFEERLDSKNLQQLLVATLKSDVNDTTRFEMVKALTAYADSNIVTEVFEYSLLNDPNPGVRLAALKSLTQLTERKNVRAVLAQALQNDINTGVRVLAFNALNDYSDDPNVLATLKSHAINDSNVYIRNSTKSILEMKLANQAPQT